MSPSRYARAPMSSIPTGFGFTRQTFEMLEDFIADNQASKLKSMAGLDMIVRSMAMVTKGLIQEKAGGPVAPRHRSVPALANRIPVQRITGAYYAGWKIKRLGLQHWALWTDTKEAYLIEVGLYQRTRRPILKMSVIGMLRLIQTTRTAERFMENVLAPRRNSKGQFQSFEDRLGRNFKMSMTAPDLPDRGVGNPNIAGPQGQLP